VRLSLHALLDYIIVFLALVLQKINEPIKVKYLSPQIRSDNDYMILAYVGEQPWMLNKRLGTDQIVPPGTSSGQLIFTTSTPGAYRAIYIDGVTDHWIAASDICYIFPKPTVAPVYSYTRLKEPPVVLHPQFRLLTENPEDFKNPVPAYFNVNFQLNPRSIQIALQVDPALPKLRLELVPTHLEDDEFWKNYFYRMVLLDTTSTFVSKTLPRQQELKETKKNPIISSTSQQGGSSDSQLSTPTKSIQSSPSEVLSSDSSIITYTEL